MFEEYKEAVLAEYNKSQPVPVNEYDRYFKAYLIGAMSVMISDTAYKNSIRRYKNKNKENN
jgi:hypothetical protein